MLKVMEADNALAIAKRSVEHHRGTALESERLAQVAHCSLAPVCRSHSYPLARLQVTTAEMTYKEVISASKHSRALADAVGDVHKYAKLLYAEIFNIMQGITVRLTRMLTIYLPRLCSRMY